MKPKEEQRQKQKNKKNKKMFVVIHRSCGEQFESLKF